jgi:hypothetical protein
MLTFSIELCSYELDLIDGLRGIAELAWRTEPLWIGRCPKPQLIDSCESEIQLHLVTCAVFTKIEWHSQNFIRGISEMQYLSFWKRDSDKCLIKAKRLLWNRRKTDRAEARCNMTRNIWCERFVPPTIEALLRKNESFIYGCSHLGRDGWNLALVQKQ